MGRNRRRSGQFPWKGSRTDILGVDGGEIFHADFPEISLYSTLPNEYICFNSLSQEGVRTHLFIHIRIGHATQIATLSRQMP
jgi:hypothetical protein